MYKNIGHQNDTTLTISSWNNIIVFTISHGSCNEMLLITSSTFIMKARPLFQNEAILRKFGMDNFTDVIKTAITLISRDFKNSIITRIVVNYVFKENVLSLFPNITKITGSW